MNAAWWVVVVLIGLATLVWWRLRYDLPQPERAPDEHHYRGWDLSHRSARCCCGWDSKVPDDSDADAYTTWWYRHRVHTRDRIDPVRGRPCWTERRG